MRLPRLKIDPRESAAVYHAFSRTPNGEWLFSDTDKEKFRELAWLLADYCGVDLFTHTGMSNHFHLIVRVPLAEPVSDAELLRRYRLLHPRPTPDRPERIEVLEALLRRGGPDAEAWRARILATMGDISQYLKHLKQFFTAWYNEVHERFGTLWSGRFGHTVIEPGAALAAVMAYVDLNCVRAGIVDDPKDYRFCGYAEAVAGHERARKGLMALFDCEDWETAQAEYRKMVFAIGAAPREQAAMIATAMYERVMKEGGKLTVATVVRCRVSYFTRGLVLGSVNFVQEQMARVRSHTGLRLQRLPRLLPELHDWGEWAAFRKVRRRRGYVE